MSIQTSLTSLKQAKTDIYNKILEKGGTTHPDSGFSAFADQIETIPTGFPSASPKEVNFYDYDGKLLYSYTLAEAQSLAALPAAPDHSSDTIPLTFQGWNYTLAQINALTQAADVGAMYIPSDGKSHLVITLYNTARNVVPLYWSQTVANGVTIDWGDGSTTETFAGAGNKNTTHTYAAAGTYEITLDVTSGNLGFGAETSEYSVMGETSGIGMVYCNMLQSVGIGSSVTSISDYAFQFCCSLASITIPEGVTSISDYAFQFCCSLASITIPSSVTSIGDSAFRACYSLASITIPSGVTSIGIFAFAGCSSLASVTIPSGVTSIGISAFRECYSLASITIPSRVTSISDEAFIFCSSLASVTIPSGVTSIGSYAFYACYSLASVTIPSGVTSIGDEVFNGCTGVGAYHVLPTTPPTLSDANAFSDIPSDCIIYVPAASLAAYQAATNWSTYTSSMVGE
jgi:PKD repeat protein